MLNTPCGPTTKPVLLTHQVHVRLDVGVDAVGDFDGPRASGRGDLLRVLRAVAHRPASSCPWPSSRPSAAGRSGSAGRPVTMRASMAPSGPPSSRTRSPGPSYG